MFYSSAHLQECKGRKNRWRGVLKYKDPNTGVWRERKRTFEDIRKKGDALLELGRWRDEMEEEALRLGLNVADCETVSRVVEDLLEFQYSLHRISISTFQGMRRTNKTVIAPRLGRRNFYEISRDDLQEFVNDLARTYAPSSVRVHFAVLSKTYKDAYRRGLIAKDPTEGVVLPKLVHNQVNYLDELGRVKFLVKMSADTRYYLPAMIAYYTGMRAGEICALQWRDVDFNQRTLSVRQAAVFCEGPDGGDVVIGVPKTPKSRRTIPLIDQLLDILLLENVAHGAKKEREPDSFVIAQRNPHLLCSGFQKWSIRNEVYGVAGSPITMHGLRHTFATLAVQSGMDVKSLSSMLGHVSAILTLDTYASDDETAKRVAMETYSVFLRNEGVRGERLPASA